MIRKDGFDENMRLEMHEDAEKSTYSTEEGSKDGETGSDLSQNLPDEEVEPDNQILTSQASNGTVEIQNFSPLPTRMVSTPDTPPVNLALEQTKTEILKNLSQVQELCEDTMSEVRALKTKCSKTEIDTKTLKVIIDFNLKHR